MMEYDKLDPTMPLKYPCTRYSIHLAILVIINLCPVMMSQSGDITSLNGLGRPWDAFIQTICARKEKLQFDSLWEECVQEEARVAN